MSDRSRHSSLRLRLLSVVAVFSGAFLAACGDGSAPADYTAEELEAAKQQLRDHARLRTFEAGKLFGDEWVVRAPDDAELRGLYAYQLAGWGLSREVREQADIILAGDPENPWGLYAEAHAHRLDNEPKLAHETALKAWEKSRQPEFILLYLRALAPVDLEAARDLLEGLDEETRGWPEVVRMQAEMESRARYELDDPTWADSSRATWAEFKEKFPDHVLGYTRLATEASNGRRMDEWAELMETALELAPGSSEVRVQHWRGLWMSDLLPREERLSAVEASMAAYREASPETVEGLEDMAAMYWVMEDEEQAAELEARIVESDPGGYHASIIYRGETLRASRKREEIREEHGADSPEYRTQLEVVRDVAYRYLERPLYNDRNKGLVYLTLFETLREMDTFPAEELAEAVRGLAKYERVNPSTTFGEAPLAMIDHTPYALEAADIAREGVHHAFEFLKRLRGIFSAEGEFDQALRASLSTTYDVIGWAHFKAGRTEDGRHNIERALAIADQNRDARYHLGQVYERLAEEAEEEGATERITEWLDRAEDSYIAGFRDPSAGFPAVGGPNPNGAALEALYERRNGTARGPPGRILRDAR